MFPDLLYEMRGGELLHTMKFVIACKKNIESSAVKIFDIFVEWVFLLLVRLFDRTTMADDACRIFWLRLM